MMPSRTRRVAAARMARLLVLTLSCCAAVTLALLVRSCTADFPQFGALEAVRETPPASTPPARREMPTSDVARLEPVGETGAGARRLSPLEDLRSRFLTLPVVGTRPEQLVASFGDERGAGRHEAIDVLAPTGTPVVAVESGRIEKLFVSQRGGLTIYQFDSLGRYAYYYAHLDRYADGLREGQHVSRGQVIGYVGVSGNAPDDTPHLHFAIFELGPEKRWWRGTPIDPYLVWRPEG